MSAANDTETGIRDRLRQLLDAGGLRPTVAEAGAALHERIGAPVRVTVFGLPDTGKTRIINLLMGRYVLPLGIDLPTTTLTLARTPGTSATLPDGSRKDWPGVPLDQIALVNPALVEISLPDALLRHLTLMRIAADDSIEDQQAAMMWAARQTDIALWCSRDFTPEEAALWAGAPESLRDNGYLVLTGHEPAKAPAVDFLGSFVIRPDQSDPQGGSALMGELRRRADRGRQAYLDHALLFLNRYAPAGASAPAQAPVAATPVAVRAATRAPTQAEVLAQTLTAAQARAANTTAAPEPANRPAPGPVKVVPKAGPERAAPTAATPEAAPGQADSQPTAQPLPSAGKGPVPDLSQVCCTAVALLRDRARDLSKALPSFGPKPAPMVFGHCIETMDALVERLAAVGAADLSDLVLDTADAIVLLQGEGGTAQAADSVTLLLQLRRDLETRIAA